MFGNRMKSDKKYTIGISCIGSGVGQAVINSCRLSGLSLRTVGLGTNPMAYGLYESDDYACTPSCYDQNYLEEMLQTCREHQIDLLIPGHDDEAHLLSKHIADFESFGIQVIVSGADLLNLCNKKQQMSETLNPIVDIFVRSFTREAFIRLWSSGEIQLPVIAKPLDGSASKGVEVIRSESDFCRISEGHIAQEIAVPHRDDPNQRLYLEQIAQGINLQIAEVSIQLVFGVDGELLGKMASSHRLKNGVPIEILPFRNESMWASIDLLLPVLRKLGARGPVNLQGRMTDDGLKLFEMNARFTGITGLRAMMGFNEVEACIQDRLIGGFVGALQINHNRVGIRQTADKVVCIDRNVEVKQSVLMLNQGQLKQQKAILVTGSTGMIGRRITRVLAESGRFEVITLDRDKVKASTLHSSDSVQSYDWEDLDAGRFALGNVDCLLHLASARPHHRVGEIAKSLRLGMEFLTRAAQSGVAEVIYISSQSVYGHAPDLPWSEDQQVAPQSPYGEAKYAQEVFLQTLAKMFPQLRHTSIRLATVTGPDSEFTPHEALAKIIKRLKSGLPVEIYGGSQRLERIDVRDAVDAIGKIVMSDSSLWKTVYNLGTGESPALLEIVQEIVRKINLEFPDMNPMVRTNHDPEKMYPSFQMDVSRFCDDFNWKPARSVEDLVLEIEGVCSTCIVPKKSDSAK